MLLLTAPFDFEAEHTVVRAEKCADGATRHLLPPIYHGDPMNGAGALCFQEFGWDLLDHMREAGFARVELVTGWASGFGYLGSHQSFFVAWR
jgi:hypothetical protein